MLEITYLASSTYSQKYLQRGVGHLDELKIHQAARYRYISVVLGRPGGGRGDGRHPAPRAVLHPPGAMHGQVERQDKVRVLAGGSQRERERVELHPQTYCEADHQQVSTRITGFNQLLIKKTACRIVRFEGQTREERSWFGRS